MINGSEDWVCPAEEALRYANQIPSMFNFVTVEGGDHANFVVNTGSDMV